MIKAGQSVVADQNARKGFLIPISWEVYDFVRVQANSLEEAYKYLEEHIDEVPLGEQPKYATGSYQVGTYEECEEYLDEVVKYDD